MNYNQAINLAETIYQLTKTHKGCTVAPDWTEELPTQGYYVADSRSIALDYAACRQEHIECILRFIVEHPLAPGQYYGGWLDDGVMWIEVATHFANELDARKFAHDHNQIFIWDIHHKCARAA